jgi:hypothetical protein
MQVYRCYLDTPGAVRPRVPFITILRVQERMVWASQERPEKHRLHYSLSYDAIILRDVVRLLTRAHC